MPRLPSVSRPNKQTPSTKAAHGFDSIHTHSTSSKNEQFRTSRPVPRVRISRAAAVCSLGPNCCCQTCIVWVVNIALALHIPPQPSWRTTFAARGQTSRYQQRAIDRFLEHRRRAYIPSISMTSRTTYKPSINNIRNTQTPTQIPSTPATHPSSLRSYKPPTMQANRRAYPWTRCTS